MPVRTRPPMPAHNAQTRHTARTEVRQAMAAHGRDAACSGSKGGKPRQHKRLTRYACTPFLSTAKEREERMPPLNPPASRHAGASDAKIHKLAGHKRPSSNSMNFGRAQRWHAGRRIRRGRAIQRTATSGRGFAQSRMAETLRAAAPRVATVQTVQQHRHAGLGQAPCGASARMAMAQCYTSHKAAL